MRRFAEFLYLLSITAWVGGTWCIGYLVAPVLFSSLSDRTLAGQLAGRMFEMIGWLGLAAATYVAVFLLGRWGTKVFRRSVFWLVLVMALLVAAIQFGIQPLMAELKADAFPRDVMESIMRERFAMWHGVSSILYLMQSLLGAWLIAWNQRGLR